MWQLIESGTFWPIWIVALAIWLAAEVVTAWLAYRRRNHDSRVRKEQAELEMEVQRMMDDGTPLWQIEDALDQDDYNEPDDDWDYYGYFDDDYTGDYYDDEEE